MSVDPKTQSLFDAISTVNYDRVKLIIDSGVAINSLNDRGQTPLTVACNRGSLEIVDLLIAAGAQKESALESILPDAEVTYAFDIDEIFAASEMANAKPISVSTNETATNNGEMFVDSELTLTSLNNNSAQQVEFEASETYAFDLSRDLDRLSFESQQDPDCLSVPMGDWDADETYAMDNFDSLIPELDDFAAKSSQQGFLADPHNQVFVVDVAAMRKNTTQTNQPVPTIETNISSQSIDELGEGETYAIDLDDLNLGRLMDGIDADAQAVSGFSRPSSQNPAISNHHQSIDELGEGETCMIDDLGEGETYAIDLDDLNLAQLMDGIDADAQAVSGFSRPGDQHHQNIDQINQDWTEGETYAVDLCDLSLTRLMDRIDADGNSSDGSPHTLPDIDSSLFPVFAGDDEPDFTLEEEESTDIFGQSAPKPADLAPRYDENATNTSLMAAVIDGDLNLVKQAIEAGASLDRYDWNLSYAPLGMAIDRGYLDIVECLLKAGANPHCGSTSTSALGLAAENGESNMIQLLLARKIDVNMPIAPDGWTALLAAVKNGHQAVVQLLIAAGANINVWSRGETPVLLAAKCEEREIYNYLYPLVNTSIRLCADRDGEQLLQSTQKRRIRQQNRPIEKFIEMATEGNIGEVNRAIEIGIEIDELGAKGHTALMAAAYYGHQSIVKVLLAAGADPNLLSDDDGLGSGMTALMLAAGSFFASNRQQILQLLIAGGADVNQRGVGGKTALFAAALTGSGYLDCVETLIAAGADLDCHNDRGHTVLTSVAAAENYAILNLLMQAGASTAGLDSIQLIQAAGAGNLDRVKSLLANKVNLDLDRGAAIGNAAAAGHTQIVELLIQAGANVNLTDKLGFSPIASAAYSGYGEIVNLLIAAGADIQAPASESQSYSALEYAHMGLYQFDARFATNAQRAVANSELEPPVNLQHDQIIRQLEQLVNCG
jgi:ankyrin repeat protein